MKPKKEINARTGEVHLLMHGKKFMDFHSENKGVKFINKKTGSITPMFIVFWAADRTKFKKIV